MTLLIGAAAIAGGAILVKFGVQGLVTGVLLIASAICGTKKN